jgi:hypothetical protein
LLRAWCRQMVSWCWFLVLVLFLFFRECLYDVSVGSQGS